MIDVTSKNIEYNGLKVTKINVKPNKSEKGPPARVDLTMNDVFTEYNIPAFINNDKLKIVDKKQFVNGKQSGFNESHIHDMEFQDKISEAVNEIWLAQRDSQA